ncbi:MAG: hypothetical protein HYX93_01705, partial [Chloroflexi bacterium]|nr:hypothetical protein [Chloroflexota bacterium]
MVIQGIERSLANTLFGSFDIESNRFLTADENDLALGRLRQDLQDPSWQIADVRREDLISYLDLGQLVGLINRHKGNAGETKVADIEFVTRIFYSQGIIAIRKRVMHPIRPLESDDLRRLRSIANEVLPKAASMNWEALKEAVVLLDDSEMDLDFPIPSYLAGEDSPVIHNLPPADFDNTGFIDRVAERNKLGQLLETDQKVFTIVGGGGSGKSALALRVCNDMLDLKAPLFRRIVWVTLKTRYLSGEGVREIANAIESVEAVMEAIADALPVRKSQRDLWDDVLKELSHSPTLLVIDNMETIGLEIRDILIRVPAGSKILMTSRIGLGEIEQRFELPDFSSKDAQQLFRRLAVVYNYDSLLRLTPALMTRYCESLSFNPLLIKWFVHAVGGGADPNGILRTGGELDKALEFCHANVYKQLPKTSQQLIEILLSSRTELTKAQLQELAHIGHEEFTKAYQALQRSSMTTRRLDAEGTALFTLDGLVTDYLSRFHPPAETTVQSVRAQMRGWQQEQYRSDMARQSYRYDKTIIHVSNTDERIAAHHL